MGKKKVQQKKTKKNARHSICLHKRMFSLQIGCRHEFHCERVRLVSPAALNESVRLCLCVCVCENVEGIKDVMQDYPAGRLPTSSAEEEMERQRGCRGKR